jgi:hypothetical protein
MSEPLYSLKPKMLYTTSGLSTLNVGVICDAFWC